jgi:hypothetical protein
VLDNLPHDKVVFNPSTQRYDRFSIVNLDTNEEKLESVDGDELVKDCLELYLKHEKFKDPKKTEQG